MNAPFPGVRRLPVIRISLSYVYQLALNLEPLATLPQKAKLNDIIYRLYIADQSLSELLSTSLFARYLRVSTPSGSKLLGSIKSCLQNQDLEQEINQYIIVGIINLHQEYRTNLLAELASLDAYFVARKGAFDTTSLLLEGEAIFPPTLSIKVPEAITDAREAAKSLAFELSTAAGFHAFRALECVVRKYYLYVTGGNALPRMRNLGIYIKALERTGRANPKVLETLRQIASLHRNPLIHPDVALAPDEAISIIGVVQSAVSAMLNELPVPQAAPLSTLGQAFMSNTLLGAAGVIPP